MTTAQDRLVGGIGSALVVALIGYALLVGLTVARLAPPVETETVLALSPPVAKPPPRPRIAPPRTHVRSGAAAPRNFRNKATEVVAPKPPIVVPPPLIAAPKPGVGAAANTGASDRAGPGTGAGGRGNGTGSGGSGNGEGDGGTAPRAIVWGLKMSNLPEPFRPIVNGRVVEVLYEVETNGRVGDCHVTATSGVAAFDAIVCQLIQRRFRYKPARDEAGRAVVSTVSDTFSWTIEHEGPDQADR